MRRKSWRAMGKALKNIDDWALHIINRDYGRMKKYI